MSVRNVSITKKTRVLLKWVFRAASTSSQTKDRCVLVHVSQGRAEVADEKRAMCGCACAVEEVRTVLREAWGMGRSLLQRLAGMNDEDVSFFFNWTALLDGRNADLASCGKRFAWMDVMDEMGCCGASTWLSCDCRTGRCSHVGGVKGGSENNLRKMLREIRVYGSHSQRRRLKSWDHHPVWRKDHRKGREAERKRGWGGSPPLFSLLSPPPPTFGLGTLSSAVWDPLQSALVQA